MSKPRWAMDPPEAEFYLPWYALWQASALIGLFLGLLTFAFVLEDLGWLEGMFVSLLTMASAAGVVQLFFNVVHRLNPICVYRQGLVGYGSAAEIYATWHDLESLSVRHVLGRRHLRITTNGSAGPHLWVLTGIFEQEAFRRAVAERLPPGHPKLSVFEPDA